MSIFNRVIKKKFFKAKIINLYKFIKNVLNKTAFLGALSFLWFFIDQSATLSLSLTYSTTSSPFFHTHARTYIFGFDSLTTHHHRFIYTAEFSDTAAAFLAEFSDTAAAFLGGFVWNLFIFGGVVIFLLMACQKMDMIMFPRNYCGIHNLIDAQKFSKQTRKFDRPSYRKSSWPSRRILKIAFALNTDGFTDNNDQGNTLNEGSSSSGLGGTRLGRIVSAGGRELLSKLNTARKNFPTKVFLLLLGFYTANALATILGQTGDWDVLVAGIVVAAIEGIGMLMYKRPVRTKGRFQSLVGMVNYWKAGVCLGLFVDAFKLGS